MKYFSLLVLIFSFNIFAENLEGNYTLINSKIDYQVKYLIKKADGSSDKAKGKGECKNLNCEFLVAAPIKSFESKDANRDLNMLNTVKAEKNPLVSAKIISTSEIKDGKLICDLEINFGGIVKQYLKIPLEISGDKNKFKAEGRFDLVLDDHKIEKPSLLGVAIENLVPIHLQAEWSKN